MNVRLARAAFHVFGYVLQCPIPNNTSRSPQSDFDLMTEIAIDLFGIDPERRAAFHLEPLGGGIVVPLDSDSIFYRFAFWTGDANA